MITDMRKELKKFSGVLWIIIASMVLSSFGFLFFNQPGGFKTLKVAVVDGNPIYASEFQEQLMTTKFRLDQYKYYAKSQGVMPELGDPSKIALDELAINKLLDSIHSDLNIKVDDDYFASYLVKSLPPQLLDASGNINEKYYQQLLSRMNLNVNEYEDKVENDIKRNVVKSIISNASYIPRRSVEHDFNKANQKKNFNIIELSFNTYLNEAKNSEPSSEELSDYFGKNKRDYRVEEKRSAKYWSFSPEDYSKKINVSDKDIDAFYARNKSTMFRIPPEIKIRRISIPVDDADPIEVSREKIALIKTLKSDLESDPSSFAALAKKHSAHKSASKGGLIDFFKRGTHDPGLEQEAFKLQKSGEVSGLVRLKDSVELIQLVERRPAKYRPLGDVRDDIIESLRAKKGLNMLKAELKEASFKARSNPDALDEFVASKSQKAKVTDLISKNEAVGFEFKNTLVSKLFDKKFGYFEFEGKYILYKEDKRQKSFTPKLDDIRSKVLEDYYADRARVAISEAAKEAKASLLSGQDIKKKATSTGMLDSASKISGIEDSEMLLRKAFDLSASNQVLKYKLDENYYLITLGGIKASEKPLNDEYVLSRAASGKWSYLSAFIASLLRDAKIERVKNIFENIS